MKRMRKLLAGTVIYMTIVSFSVAQTTDSIEMGPGYANDVFYSLATGEVKTEEGGREPRVASA